MRQNQRAAAGGTGARHLRVIVAVLAATQLAGCGYRRIQELGELAQAARTDIEIQLQRRAELVPNLIETLSAHVTIGQETIAALADARAELVRAVRSSDVQAMQEGSARLCAAITRLLEAGRMSPGLESDPGFSVLRSRLDGTEQQIRAAAHAYNEAVRRYNEYIRSFPQLVTARVIDARELESFDYDGAVPVRSPADE